jgi:cell division protease FtsH
MASAEVCSALPKTTWPTASAGTPARSSAPFAATTPRSVALWSLSAPPKVPNGGARGREEDDVGVLALGCHAFVRDSTIRTLRGSRRVRDWVIFAVLLAVAATALLAFTVAERHQPQEISYTEMLRAVENGQVASLTVRPGQDVRGAWRAGSAPAAADVDRGFVASYPLQSVDEITTRAQGAGVEVVLQSPRSGTFYRDLFGYGLQLLVLGGVGFFLFMHFRGREGSNAVGKTEASTTSFDDVAGTQGAAEELRELVEFLREPQSLAAVGARIPKGALLIGPPGTGKTLLARAVAGEAGVPFFSISGSEVTGFIVGLGAHRLKSLFKKARKNGGVIFIDEIDALGGKRGRNQSHNEDDRTLNQLLVEMDGFSPSATGGGHCRDQPRDDLDPALKRPGRFDRMITVGLPSTEGREAILRLHARRREIPLSPDVDLARLARLTPHWSGAELANLLNEAAITAGRLGMPEVTWAHIEIARDRILLGKERIGFTAPDREWQTVAYHEAGHALGWSGVLPRRTGCTR